MVKVINLELRDYEAEELENLLLDVLYDEESPIVDNDLNRNLPVLMDILTMLESATDERN